MKELRKEFEVQLICLGENTKKYITVSVPLKKEKYYCIQYTSVKDGFTE